MGSGFLTGIVAIVDSDGNRIDLPNENGDYAPVELQLGTGLTATKTTNGSLTRVTLNATGGGGGVTPRVVNLDPGFDGSQTFNGDGSAGATQIYPFTILFAGQDDDAVYNFDSVAVEEGWIVLFDFEGTDATIEIQNQEDPLALLTIDDNTKQVTGIYFNDGDWRLIQIHFQVS
jgi:hypothetical protein